jgi:hypothetical protein
MENGAHTFIYLKDVRRLLAVELHRLQRHGTEPIRLLHPQELLLFGGEEVFGGELHQRRRG